MFHKHKKFGDPNYYAEFINPKNMDDTVDWLLAGYIRLRNENKEFKLAIEQIKSEFKLAIGQIKSDLAAIHSHYRNELCSDCCHVQVCGIFPKVKYGFECDERTICMIEIESENTADETEPSKEESPCCSKSGDGD